MKNNEYKKYFDQVSPEQNLIEDTKKRMLQELNNSSVNNKKCTKISFMRYGVLAACAAIAAVSVAMVPKPVKTNIPDSDSVADENQIDRTFTDTQTTSSVTKKKTTSVNSAVIPSVSSVGTENDQIISGIITTVNSYPPDSNVPQQINTKNSSPVTTTTISKYYTDVPKQTVGHTQSEPSSPTLNSETVAVTTNLPCCTMPVTYPASSTVPETSTNTGCQTLPEFKPGSSPNKDPATDIGGGPPLGGADHVYYNEYVEADGYSGNINVNIENEYYAPRFKNTVSISLDMAQRYFGTDICPQILKDQYPDFVVQTDDKYGLENGVGMIFGEYSGLDVKDSKYIVMAVSEMESNPLGYMLYMGNPLQTYINENGYTFAVLSQYTDTCFCSFQRDGLYYNICFKGYNLTDIVQLLLSF